MVNRPHAFAREKLSDLPGVTLTTFSPEGRIPLRWVVWSHRFPDELSHDKFFAWIAERVDRWEDWGERGYQSEAAALLQHLFATFWSRPL